MQIFADNLGFFSIHTKKLLYKILIRTLWFSLHPLMYLAIVPGGYPIQLLESTNKA